MGYGYGLVNIATVTSGGSQMATAPTGANTQNSAIRVFDAALVNTAGSVALYAGTAVAPTKLILLLDVNNPFVHSDVGFRFADGVYAFAAGVTLGAAVATVTYIKEF